MRKLSSSLIVAAGVFAAFGASAGGFREDEIYCEEATARLAKCCPSFDVRVIECNYIDNSTDCTTSVQYPSLEEVTSKCIIALDCGSLVSTGVCERAEQLGPRIKESGDGGGVQSSGGSASVCP